MSRPASATAGAGALQQARDHQHGEVHGNGRKRKTGHTEHHGNDERCPVREPAVAIRRNRNDDGHHEQVAGREPLHDGHAHVELVHENREQHVRHRLGEDADECHDAHGDNREEECSAD